MNRTGISYRRDAETRSSIRQNPSIYTFFRLLRAASMAGCTRVCGLILAAAIMSVAQVPTPKSVLGFHPTDDKTIADWNQITDYFAKLDRASPKVLVKKIGKST